MFETSSGPAADLARSQNRVCLSSPLVKSMHGFSLSLVPVQKHGDNRVL